MKQRRPERSLREDGDLGHGHPWICLNRWGKKLFSLCIPDSGVAENSILNIDLVLSFLKGGWTIGVEKNYRNYSRAGKNAMGWELNWRGNVITWDKYLYGEKNAWYRRTPWYPREGRTGKLKWETRLNVLEEAGAEHKLYQDWWTLHLLHPGLDASWVINFKAESHEVSGTPGWSPDTQGTERVHQTVCLLPKSSTFEVVIYTGETTH